MPKVYLLWYEQCDQHDRPSEEFLQLRSGDSSAEYHTELDLILEIFEGSWLGVFVWHCAVLSIQLGTAGFFRTGPESLESGLGTGVCDIVAYALRRGRLVFFAHSLQKNPHDCIGHLIVAYLAAGVDHRRAHHIA